MSAPLILKIFPSPRLGASSVFGWKNCLQIWKVAANIFNKQLWGWAMSCMWERRGAYRVLVGKPEGRRPLVKTSRNWEYNIKIVFSEVE